MANEFTDEDDALLAELGVEVEEKKVAARTPREERIIAGFEEIQRFVEEHGHHPLHGESRDIFERLYAVRLDRIRTLEECRTLIEPLDHQGLLSSCPTGDLPVAEDIDDDELLRRLGVEEEYGSLTDLKHVRSVAEKREAEEIANREKCEDFDQFRHLFEKIQSDIDAGVRTTRPFEVQAEIQQGSWFIVGGQKAYVAEMDDIFLNKQDRPDARLRVIFDNGTESNLLMRSLQRALHRDEAGRRITEPEAGPLFSGHTEPEDLASGTVYVLRSLSDHSQIAPRREFLHKIGVTGGSVERRIANAARDATFLLADVEVVATYQLYNINRIKFENLIHRVLEPARLDVDLRDRFGNPVVPREWFIVPIFVIDEIVERFKDGTIGNLRYDPEQAKLIAI